MQQITRPRVMVSVMFLCVANLVMGGPTVARVMGSTTMVHIVMAMMMLVATVATALAAATATAVASALVMFLVMVFLMVMLFLAAATVAATGAAAAATTAARAGATRPALVATASKAFLSLFVVDGLHLLCLPVSELQYKSLCRN